MYFKSTYREKKTKKESGGKNQGIKRQKFYGIIQVYLSLLFSLSDNFICSCTLRKYTSRTVQRTYSGSHGMLNLLQNCIYYSIPQVTFKDLQCLDFIRAQTLAKHHFLSPVSHKKSLGDRDAKVQVGGSLKNRKNIYICLWNVKLSSMQRLL